MTRLRWVHDLLLGARLAVSGRGGLARLTLISVGVGMGVAVLLLTGSLVHADDVRNARQDARVPQAEATGAGSEDPPLLIQYDGTQFRGDRVRGLLLDPVAADPPMPPGIDRLPAHGEVYLSPALADLLASPEGELLRPRFPWTVAGTIGQPGLVGPDELWYYAGADLPGPQAESSSGTSPAYGFGVAVERPGLNPVQVMLGLGAGLMLLLPVFVLVGAATRVAAAARERRLAALRLTGADARQTARIASGEALVGSIVGLLVGAAIFLAVTPFAEHVALFGYSAFREDLRPPAAVVVMVVIGVPALAVVAGLVALRHTVVHPLGTTRRAEPPRRRLWWRLIPMATGVAVLVPLADAGTGAADAGTQVAVLAGLLLLGISVPLLLPWLLQRAVGWLSAGPPSWQLAVRRIQLDSSTPARAAAGIAALLTVAVAIQTLLNTALAQEEQPDAGERRTVGVDVGDAAPAELTELDLTGIDGLQSTSWFERAFARMNGDGATVELRVGECAALADVAELGECADGDAFVLGMSGHGSGGDLVFSRWQESQDSEVEIGRWTVPAESKPARARADGPGQVARPVSQETAVLVTPSAADGIPSDVLRTIGTAVVDQSKPDAVEHLRNALAPIGRVSVNDVAALTGSSYTAQLRNAVLAGSLIVLVLAAASMLIVSIEQVRERRQQLAAMAAGGVGNRTLGGSVLWQALLPFAVAAVAAVAVGVTLAGLFLRVIDEAIAIDWAGIAVLTAACLAAVVVVTVLTLPSLRAATRPESLRTE